MSGNQALDESAPTAPAPLSFGDLGVPEPLVEALRMARITEPFEIQELTLPDALAGRDILGRAPTGSGKTLAFGIPVLARLADTDKARKRRPRGLILSPTRELAEQIARELESLARSVRRRLLAVYGGKGLGAQLQALNAGVDVLIACPGRLLDLIDQGAVSLDEVEIAVVDEADRMADMGFLPDVRKILDMTAAQRQTVLFSATLDNDVKVLIDRYQTDPIQHAVAEPEPDLSVMEHRFYRVPKKERLPFLADLIDDTGPTVVFARTRHGVDRLARQLRQQGVTAGNIHGGRSQAQRDRALQVFTEGKVQALVATDVAARGIHVDGVACVAHYDPPAELKDYVHRSGRTARAGATGVVVSFLDPSEVRESQKLQRTLGIEADIVEPVESPNRAARLADAKVTLRGDKRSGAGSGSGSASSRSNSRSKPKPASKNGSKPASRSGSRPASTSRSKPASKNGAKPAARSRNGSGPSEDEARPTRKRGSGPTRPGGKKRGGAKKRAGSRAWADSASNSDSPGGGGRGAKRSAKAGSKSGSSGGGRSAKAGSKPGAKSGPGAKGAKKRTTKRSGKPRPSNRKNKPRTSRS